MDLLVIETFTWTPHVETAAEICMKQAQAGRSVGFAFIHLDNPDERARTWLDRCLGINPRNKVRQLGSLLQSQGVTLIDSPELSVASRRAVNDFSKQQMPTLDCIRKLSYGGGSLGMGVASSLIFHTNDAAPDPANFRTLVARYCRASAMLFELSSALIVKYRPKAVLTFNGRFACSRPIAEAARQLKVNCMFHERGANLERYIVESDSVHDFARERRRIADMWASAGPERADVGRSFFMKRQQGDGIGWRSYTGRQIRGATPPQQRGRRIVYFHSSDDEYAALEGVNPHIIFSSQRQAIEFLVDWTSRRADVELVIRLHPHIMNKPERETRYWDSLKRINVFVEPPENETDSYALAESADLVTTYGSTMGVESAFLGKPVLLLGDCGYRGLHCVYEPQTREEVRALLTQSNLPPKPPQNCLPYGYYSMTFGTRYRFYNPESLFEGSFMGTKLTMEPEYLQRLRMSSLGYRLIKAKRRFVRSRVGNG